jgi:2-dehydro-3-deoxyphosphogluconate aldolase/(4S)-4-hydroxy-2-oxoglutarate aldolase
MNTILDRLALNGIVPVVVIDDETKAVPLAEALLEGGLSTMEVTFRTSAARNAIAHATKAYPAMLVGAGTVLTVEQAKAAVDAGAQYIVSPGLNSKVVEYCQCNNIAVTPGVATPTEIEAAMEMGLEVVKFFPAEANGGLDYLKAISAPYGKMKFIPTGGIDESNLLLYLKFPKVLACGGSWMVRADLIASKNFKEIQRLTGQAVSKMLGLHLARVGLHHSSASEASASAAVLSSLLRIPVTEKNDSVSVGAQFELLAAGKSGYVAIGTHFVDRALAYFKRQGINAKEGTLQMKDGVILSAHLHLGICGFDVCLVQD